MKRKHSTLAVALASAMAFAAIGCGSPQPPDDEDVTEKPQKPDWRKLALALEIEGVALTGDRAQETKWSGSGFWIAPNRIVTNAHVANRARTITGTDDEDRVYKFDSIVALDEKNDLAILATDTSPPAGLVFPTPVERAEILKELRSGQALSVGNTGGKGLSTYDCGLVDILDLGDEAAESIVHDCRISSGSSGGPLFDRGVSKLYGVNKAIKIGGDESYATPAWTLTRLLERSRSNAPVPLAAAYDPAAKDLGRRSMLRTQSCLQPGTQGQLLLGALPAGRDVQIQLAASGASPLIYQLALQLPDGRRGLLDANASFRGTHTAQWSTPASGAYVLAYGVHPDAPGPACLTITFDRLMWEDNIQATSSRSTP